MKTLVLSFLITVSFLSSYAQNLIFSVQANYDHPVTKEKLIHARAMGDIIPYYPSNWIDRYLSTELTVVSGGITSTAVSTSDILSEEQMKLLRSSGFGDEIVININYQSRSHLTDKTENGKMHYAATVVPDTEATYAGGYDQLSSYIKGNAIDKISEEKAKDMQQAVIRFTINERGEIAGATILSSSGNAGIDQLLLEVINKMPGWEPACDLQGNKVSQEFELTVSNGSEGC